MINWKKDSWEEVKFVLDELEYDYECDFEGNLILHFENFEIVDENTKNVVDTVDHMFLKFSFENNSLNYKIHWYRIDVYSSKTNYVHPHVNGVDHCTGDYVRGVSLCRDLLYYSNYIERYNSGYGWVNIPEDTKININKDKLKDKLFPTFYMDITLGHPVVSNLEFDGDINSLVIPEKLSNPKTFFWKGNQLTQYPKGSRVEHIDLKKYFDYVKFFERYRDATSSISNVNVVSEVSES